MIDFGGELPERGTERSEAMDEFVHPLMPSADGTLIQLEFEYDTRFPNWASSTCSLDALWVDMERTAAYAEALIASPDSSEVVRAAAQRYLDYVDLFYDVMSGAIAPFNTYTEAECSRSAMVFAFRCGILFQQLPLLQLEDTIKRGAKQVRNLNEAWETRRVKASPKTFRDKIAEIQAHNPRLSKTQAVKLAAKELGASPRTGWRLLGLAGGGAN